MGFLTTFTIYNDGIGEIEKNKKEFAEIIIKASAYPYNNSKTYACGNHTNLIKAQHPRHADNTTIYVHAGNTVCEMNAYSQETKDILKYNTKFFDEMLNIMKDNVKIMEKQLKEFKNKKKNMEEK